MISFISLLFTRMISHTAYFDTFAKRKILGLAPEKYVVLADRANIGNAAYVECWRAHCELIGDQHALLCTAGLCFCEPMLSQRPASNQTHRSPRKAAYERVQFGCSPEDVHQRRRRKSKCLA